MTQELLVSIAKRLMGCPAIAYHEDAVRAEAETICREQGLEFERDQYGNVFIHWQQGRKQRPLVLAAHLDHPGFEIKRALAGKSLRAEFLGGVPESYFRRGVKLRLMPGAVPAVLGRRLKGEKAYALTAQRKPSTAPEFAVWELEDFAIRRGRIYGRACDDLIGCATILTTLIELKRRRAPTHVIGVLSRAEEVGFHGALTIAEARGLPKDSLVISLETSREMSPVKMGQGMILRVGDRASVFDSAATRFLNESAVRLQQRESAFKFQRALMSGGTCEATAYQEYGYQTAAVCVALGNYHNCGPGNRLRAEYVSVSDAVGMAQLLTEAAIQMKHYSRLTAKLPKRLADYARQARRRLRAA